jgi:hypothetical protein
MNRLTKRKFFLFCVAVAAIYLVAANTVPSNVLVQVLNGLFIGFSVAVTVVFAPLFWRALREPEFDDISQLTIGMGLMWVSIWISRALNAYGQTKGFASVINSPVVGFSAYLGVVGLMLHITAPGMVRDRWVYNRRIVYAAVAGGFLIAAAVIWIQGT